MRRSGGRLNYDVIKMLPGGVSHATENPIFEVAPLIAT
jgi:hypothetical protein